MGYDVSQINYDVFELSKQMSGGDIPVPPERKTENLLQSRQDKIDTLSFKQDQYKNDTLLGVYDADSPITKSLGEIRESAGNIRYDANELTHGNNAYGAGKSPYAMKTQRENTATLLGIPVTQVTNQDMIDVGNRQQIQKLTLAAGGNPNDVPLIRNSVQLNLSGKGYKDPTGKLINGTGEIPLNIPIKSAWGGETDNTSSHRKLAALMNPTTKQDITRAAALDYSQNAFAPSPEQMVKSNNNKTAYEEELKRQADRMGVMDEIKYGAKVFGKTMYDQLISQPIKFLSDTTGLLQENESARQQRLDKMFGINKLEQVKQQESQAKMESHINTIFDSKTKGADKAKAALNIFTDSITDIGMGATSFATVFSYILPASLIGKATKAGSAARATMRTIDASVEAGEISRSAAALQKLKLLTTTKEGAVETARLQTGQVWTAIGETNKQYDEWVANNNGVEPEGGRTGFIAKNLPMQLVNQNLDSLVDLNIIKSPKVLSAAKEIITSATDKQMLNMAKGIGKTVAHLGKDMASEAAQEYTQQMMEMFNTRYGSEAFKDQDSFIKFVTADKQVKEATLAAIQGAGGAVQFKAVGSILPTTGKIVNTLTPKSNTSITNNIDATPSSIYKGYTPSEIGTAIKNEFTNKSANDITKVKDEIAPQEYAPVGRGAERVSAMEAAFAADGFDVAKGLDTIKAATADLNEDEIKSIMPKLDEYIDKVEQAEAARLNNIADNGTDDDIKQYGSEPYDMLMNRHITDEKAEVLANKLKASKQYDDVEIDTALQLRKVLNSGDKLTTEEVGSEVRTEGWNKSTKQSILSWFRGAVNTNIPEKARNYYTNNFLRFAALQEAKLEKLQAGAKGAQNKLESEFERLLGERTDVTMEDMYNAAIFSADLANGDKYRDAFNKVNISHKLFREIRKKLHSFNYAADISSVGKAVKEGNFDITLKQALADYALKNRADLAMDSNKSKDLKPSGLQTVINNVSNENATIDKLLKRIYKVNGIEEVAAGTGDLDTVAPAAPQSTPLQNAMDAKNEYAATKEGMIEPSYDDSGYNPNTQFRGLDTSLDYNNLDTKSKTYDSFKKVIASYLANPKEFVAGLTEQEKPAFAQLAANGSLAVDKIANEMIEPKDNGNKGQTTIDFDAEVEQTGPTVLDQMPGLTDVELSVAKIKAHPAYEAFIKLMRPKGATGKNKVVTSAERRSLSKDNPARYLQTSVALFNRLVKGEKPLTDVQQKTILEDLGMLEKVYEGDYKGVGLSITPKTKVQPKPKIKDSSTDKKGPTADEMFSAGRGTNVDQNETLKKLKGPGLPVAVKNYLEQAAKKGISAEDAKARVQRVLAEDYNETLDKEITDIWEKNKEYKYTKGKIRDKVREARAAIYTNKEATEAEKLRGKTEVTKELRNIEAEAEEIIMQKELKEMYTSEVKQAREAYKGLTFVMKHSQVLMDEDIDPTDKEMYNKLVKQKGDLKNKLRIGRSILQELKFQMNKSKNGVEGKKNSGFMDYVRATLDTVKIIAAAAYELYKDLQAYRKALSKEQNNKQSKWAEELKAINKQLDKVIKKIKADEKAKINELNSRLRKTKVGVRESAMYNSKLLTELHALVSNVDSDTTKAASTKRDFNANGKPLELDPSKYLKTVNNSNNTLATQDVRTLKKRTLEGEYISVQTGLPDTLNHLIKVASATVASWDKKLELGTNPNKGVNSMPRLYEDPARALLLNPTDGLNVNVVVAAMQSMYEKMLDGGSELWDRDLEATFRDYFPDGAAVDMEAIKILAKAGKMPKRLTTEIGLATLDKLGLAKAGEKNEYAEEYSRLAASLGSFAISMAITEGSLLRNDMPLRKFQELTGAVTVSEDDKAHVKFVKLNLDDKSLDDIKRHYDNIKQNIEYPAAVKKHRWMPKTYNEDSNIDKVDCGNVM